MKTATRRQRAPDRCPAPRSLAEFEALIATIAERSKTTVDQTWGYFAFATELPRLDQLAISLVVVEMNLTRRVQRTLQILADDREERRETQ